MKVLIAGGGTGGHLFSGVALAEELAARGHAVEFVGTARGLEARLIPTLGYPLHLIEVGGLKRMGLRRTLKNLLALPRSAWQAWRVWRRVKPDAVVGVGGYASGPVVLAAALFGTPTLVIEQNSRPGMTNRLLGRVVDKVVTHFAQAAAFFPTRKVCPLGNPIRRAIVMQAQAAAIGHRPGELHVLITGGSQGAHAINEAWRLAAPALAPYAEALRIRHQSGPGDVAALQAAYAAAGLTATVTPFIDDMIAAYREADLVVARAGASTIAELAVVGKPALFVPLPTAADDHQTTNARELVGREAAWLIPQAQLTPEALTAFLRERLAAPEEWAARGERARAFGRPEAARDVADLLTDLAPKRRGGAKHE